MLIVISPAKTLDFEHAPLFKKHTIPEHIQLANQLVNILKKLSVQELASLMGISDKLAALNVARFTQWSKAPAANGAKQAILAFKGDVYTGLNIEDFDEPFIDFLQQHLCILSGLYGVLRPLDLIQPYRLEMGTKLNNNKGKDLYAFWGEHIAQWLNEAVKAQGDNLLLNLASKEYFSSVSLNTLKARVIDIEFKDLKEGRYKIISFYAKKARGMMARFIAQNQIITPEQLTQFDSEGYYWSKAHSSQDKLVFLRDKVIKD